MDIKKKETTNNKNDEQENKKLECFVIMPISDQEGYEEGHFDLVYEDIFKPAINNAGFSAYRSGDGKSSSIIHIEIIRRLIDAPMAICDVSSRNPNVLYELGIRQAFDKPVVLVGDDDPSKIFDIANINTHKYEKSLNYRTVLRDQIEITEMIKATYKSHNDGSEMNSLIKVLQLNSAAQLYMNDSNKETSEKNMVAYIYNELRDLKNEIRKDMRYNNINKINQDINLEVERCIEFSKKTVNKYSNGIINEDEILRNIDNIEVLIKKHEKSISNIKKYKLDFLKDQLIALLEESLIK